MSISTKNIIILRSVFGKVGQKYFIMPCKNPATGLYPTITNAKGEQVQIVKKVNSQGDMILTDAERNSGDYFIPETQVFQIEDGKTFDLNDKIEARQWEAIKYCPFIASSRDAKDAKGNNLIDGTMGWKNPNPRYGRADLYIYKPDEESNRRITKKDQLRKALNFIYDDDRGNEGRLLICRLLGKNLTGISDADVTDYLVSIAEADPEKIISLYTGSDTSLRLLLIAAMDKHVIYIKDKLYMYADNIVLGATNDAAISWMKDPKNKNVLELIKKTTYPEMYEAEESAPKNNKSNNK